jgi:hypothetical protein
MDPITIASATASFEAIKRGLSLGKDALSLSAEIGKWMTCASDADQQAREAANPPLFKKMFSSTSVEEEAINSFALKKRMEQQRADLKTWIEMTLGRKAWQDLLEEEATIRKTRRDTLYKQREKRRKFVEIVGWIVMGCVAAGLLYGFVMFLKGHAAKAATTPEHVVCRLVGCEKIDGMRWCVYRGAGNTQASIMLELSEWFPREFMCKYDPDAPPPPNLRDTLKAIKESQQ